MRHRLVSTIFVVMVLTASHLFAAAGEMEFATLISDIQTLAPAQLQSSLLAKVNSSAASAARHQPCVALNVLTALRNEIAAKTAKGDVTTGKPLSQTSGATLNTDIVGVTAALLGTPESAKCGGAAVPPAEGTSPIVEVITNTTREVHLKVTFPQAHFTPRFGNGQPFTDISIDGMGDNSAVGEPHVPRITKFVAIPRGATINVEVLGSTSYSLGDIRLWPRQESAVDQALPPGAPDRSVFADKPFQINQKLYSVNAFLPRVPSAARDLGTMRDLRIGGVEADASQYNAALQQLRVYTSLDLKVTFAGDNTDLFADNRADNLYNLPFQRLYSGALLNASIVSKYLDHRIFKFCGEEVTIVTSPVLRPAADVLANARRAAGYQVGVYETGTGSGQVGTNNVDIANFLHNQITTACAIRTSYIILFGNTANVPTFLVPCGPGGNVDECNIASDLPYALATGGDLFADAAYARIPVTDLAQANDVVNKIVTYETTPPAPTGDDFYGHATTTAYFQPTYLCILNTGETGTPNCDGNHPPVTGHWEPNYANHQDDRGFTITAEAVGNAMRANGYNVDRLYTTDDANVIPETYYNGTPIPSFLQRPTFGWDANTTDFLNAYNGGRFLILHRDHGWQDGWADPTLHSGHVPFLTNGTKLPVVFGVNCASAAFDDPTHPSFVELQVTRIGGGAVAGFGDTRVSPSYPNNHMTFGFFDALFPNLVPTYGSDSPLVHLGEVLLAGKQYMATQEGIDWQGAGDTYVEHYLYHLLGDPTMQMWIAEPRRFDPKQFVFYLENVINPKPGDPPYVVKLPPLPDPPPYEGAVATLLQGGTVIGRGLIQNGTALISPETTALEGQLSVAIEQTGFLPVLAPVQLQQQGNR